MSRILRTILLGLLALAGCVPASTPSEPGGVVDPSPPAPVIGDARYACDGEPPGFLPSLLDQPAVAELEDHPTAAVLRTAITEEGPDIDMLPERGYWLVHRDDRVALYLARDPVGDDTLFHAASIEFGPEGWTLGGWGGCRPQMVLEGRNLATWLLDADAPPPGPASTSVTALVTERTCTGGQPMGARLQPPVISYGPDAILIVFAAVPLEGDAFDCPGNPPTRVVVHLDQPLGQRDLLDAGFFPPAEPVEPEF